MNRNARLLLVGLCTTDIGNGMFNLVLATLLYRRTNSPLAFAVVLSGQFLVGLLVQLFAGSVVDRTRPKQTMIFNDMVRAVALVAAAIVFAQGGGLWMLYLALIVMNVCSPFYKSASFSLTPAVVPEGAIPRLIAYKGAASQAGQLIGVALAAPVIATAGSTTGLVLDGVSFALSGLCTAAVRHGEVERLGGGRTAKDLVADWVEIGRILIRRPGAFLFLLLASGDLLFVTLLNVFLVPVNHAAGNHSYGLSLLDGGFAIGSLGVSLVTDRLIARVGNRTTALAAMLAEAVAFVAIGTSGRLAVLTVATIVLGIANTLSLSVFAIALQLRTKGPIKGRISAFRQLLLSIVVAIVLPGTAGVISRDGLRTGALVTAALVIVYFAVTALASTRRIFGEHFFTGRIEPDVTAATGISPHTSPTPAPSNSGAS